VRVSNSGIVVRQVGYREMVRRQDYESAIDLISLKILIKIGVTANEWSWDQAGNLRVVGSGSIPGNGGSTFDPDCLKNIKNIPSHSLPLMKKIFARRTLKHLKNLAMLGKCRQVNHKSLFSNSFV